MKLVNLLFPTVIIALSTITLQASPVSEIAMICKNPKITKLDKDYINVVASCKDNNQLFNRSMTIERENTYMVNIMLEMPYFIVNGFLGSRNADEVSFYNIKDIKSADILKPGEMLCQFQAFTDEEPPITECFDSFYQKWIDVRSKNIQGNFTTLRNYGTAKVIIKNNKVVNFIELSNSFE
jgi:hypothetical protein